uniref:Centromere protein P n=1 Tax=Amphiprion percula TaxID=161767 RepID=A0A3P8U964_AMPPE
MEEVQMLEAQIERLQAEVEALQRQQQDNQKDITFQFRGQIASLCGRGPVGEKERVMSSLKEEVEEMEEDLRRQTQMNGISLNGCNAKTLRSSESKVVQQLCLSGRCSELDFQVEFKLSEVKVSSFHSLVIFLFSLLIWDFSAFQADELVEESCDLLLFFRTLRTFSDRCDDRSKTFQHFQQKYPSVVSLPGGCRSEVMRLSVVFSCVLFVRWSIDVSREGGVSPNIELLTKIPDQDTSKMCKKRHSLVFHLKRGKNAIV